ncbi:hypothetical protein C6381_07910, partial [Pseudomonas syringae pv. actinidiae]
ADVIVETLWKQGTFDLGVRLNVSVSWATLAMKSWEIIAKVYLEFLHTLGQKRLTGFFIDAHRPVALHIGMPAHRTGPGA